MNDSQSQENSQHQIGILFNESNVVSLDGKESCKICGIVPAIYEDADDAFVVALSSGELQIYSAACIALLYEFPSIHRFIHHVHYTSFSDCIITLESDSQNGFFLCVYHDWRVSSTKEDYKSNVYALSDKDKLVRGYTLPLPSSSVCTAVCSFTGRIAVTMDHSVSIWQCNNGFFEHIMELMIQDMDDEIIKNVGINGNYLAFASDEQVQVVFMDIQKEVQKSKSLDRKTLSPVKNKTLKKDYLDISECISITLDNQEEIAPNLKLHMGSKTFDAETNLFDESKSNNNCMFCKEEVPFLSDLYSKENIRMNTTSNYFLGYHGITTLLRRYMSPHNPILEIDFIRDTIGNDIISETLSHGKLLIRTKKEVCIFYISCKKESTQEWNFYHHVIVYLLNSTILSIAVNSSFLFALTIDGLEIWSFWNPTRELTISNIFNNNQFNPKQPVLIGKHYLHANHPSLTWSFVIALDEYIVIIPQQISTPNDFLSTDKIIYPSENMSYLSTSCIMMILTLATPFPLFHYVQDKFHQQVNSLKHLPQNHEFKMNDDHKIIMDMMMSLFSLFCYRNDIYLMRLKQQEKIEYLPLSTHDLFIYKLNQKLYDQLSKQCAYELAKYFLLPVCLSLVQAVNLFIYSHVDVSNVISHFQSLKEILSQDEIKKITCTYIQKYSQQKSPENSKFTQMILNHPEYMNSIEEMEKMITCSKLDWNLKDMISFYKTLFTNFYPPNELKFFTCQLILQIGIYSSIHSKEVKKEEEVINVSIQEKEYKINSLSILEIIKYFIDKNQIPFLVNWLSEHVELLFYSKALSVYNQKIVLSMKRKGYSESFYPSILSIILLQHDPLILVQCLRQHFMQLERTINRKDETIDILSLLCLFGPVGYDLTHDMLISIEAKAIITKHQIHITKQYEHYYILSVLNCYICGYLERKNSMEFLMDNNTPLKYFHIVLIKYYIIYCLECYMQSSFLSNSSFLTSECFYLLTNQFSNLPDWIIEFHVLFSKEQTTLFYQLLIQPLYVLLFSIPEDSIIQDIIDYIELHHKKVFLSYSSFLGGILAIGYVNLSRPCKAFEELVIAEYYDIALACAFANCHTPEDWTEYLMFLLKHMSNLPLTCSSLKKCQYLLDDVLNKVSNSISPKQLLEMLPDSCDFYIFASALERSLMAQYYPLVSK